MKKNIGNLDFYIRIIIGIVSGYFSYHFGFSDWKSFLLVGLSILSFVTATLKFCPLYYIINTNSFKIDL